jgi:Na+:H+ antiporter, NhaA family
VLRRFGITMTPVFVSLGIGLWIAVHASGVHASIAGVVMGLLAPASPRLDREIVLSLQHELVDVFTPAAARETTRVARSSVSELEWIEHLLHPFSSLLIVPIFALANAGVALSGGDIGNAATSAVTLGVVFGLVAGKAVGISLAARLACRLGIAELGEDVTWRELTGVAALGGIGFTVSLFITELAFSDEGLKADAKVGILAASLLATLLGAVILRAGNQPHEARG